MRLFSGWKSQQASFAGPDGINRCHWGKMLPQIIGLGKAALDCLNKWGYPNVIYKQIQNETSIELDNKAFFIKRGSE